MKSVEYWQRRLTTAIQEAEDADRVWRQAMERGDGDAKTVHVLWQERENAAARADDIRSCYEAAQRRRCRRRRRLAGLRQTMAFVVWHARGRFERVPH